MDNINWQPSTNSILDLKDWTDNNRLEIAPDFQRKFVWGDAAKIMLMDTILKNIPMPKIFVSNLVVNDSPYRSVIDGQQRITAILSFIRDGFSLKKPYDGEFFGKKFSELPENIKSDFFRYKLDFNEINDASNEQIRMIYSRVNKYSTVLNKQELRRSDFPGDFLKLAEKLAVNSFFDNTKIFTITNRRRFGDAEYVSELLAGLIGGIQDKKSTLDDFYKDYANWNVENKNKIEKEFVEILEDINLIFNGKDYVGQSGPITMEYHENLKFHGVIYKTRFKQKADFYALFFAISRLKKEFFNIQNKDLNNLRLDLSFVNKYTVPLSEIELFREYATKCLSDANSKNSRQWRVNFLYQILSGSYKQKIESETNKLFSKIALNYVDITSHFTDVSGIYGCPTKFYCGKCNAKDDLINQKFTEDEDDEDFIDEAILYEDYIVDKGVLLYWDKEENNHHLTNSKFICRGCAINE
jgi:uncharacterized protein with ParB-like and HNH nuclease domain